MQSQKPLPTQSIPSQHIMIMMLGNPQSGRSSIMERLATGTYLSPSGCTASRSNSVGVKMKSTKNGITGGIYSHLGPGEVDSSGSVDDVIAFSLSYIHPRNDPSWGQSTEFKLMGICDAIWLVFGLDSRVDFEALKDKWYNIGMESIKKKRVLNSSTKSNTQDAHSVVPNIPFYLVGTKSDLDSDTSRKQSQRVTRQEIDDFIKSTQESTIVLDNGQSVCCPIWQYFETSSKDNIGIEKLYDEAVQPIIDQKFAGNRDALGILNNHIDVDVEEDRESVDHSEPAQSQVMGCEIV